MEKNANIGKIVYKMTTRQPFYQFIRIKLILHGHFVKFVLTLFLDKLIETLHS